MGQFNYSGVELMQLAGI